MRVAQLYTDQSAENLKMEMILNSIWLRWQAERYNAVSCNAWSMERKRPSVTAGERPSVGYREHCATLKKTCSEGDWSPVYQFGGVDGSPLCQILGKKVPDRRFFRTSTSGRNSKKGLQLSLMLGFRAARGVVFENCRPGCCRWECSMVPWKNALVARILCFWSTKY